MRQHRHITTSAIHQTGRESKFTAAFQPFSAVQLRSLRCLLFRTLCSRAPRPTLQSFVSSLFAGANDFLGGTLSRQANREARLSILLFRLWGSPFVPLVSHLSPCLSASVVQPHHVFSALALYNAFGPVPPAFLDIPPNSSSKKIFEEPGERNQEWVTRFFSGSTPF